MGKTDNNGLELGSLLPGPPAYAGPNGAVVCLFFTAFILNPDLVAKLRLSALSWASNVGKILLKMLSCVAWVVLEIAIAICMTVIMVITLCVIIRPLPEPTTSVQRDAPRPIVVPEYHNSTMIAPWGPYQPILRQHHSWTECSDWPKTEDCKQKICNIDFTADYHNEEEIWEYKMCFPDECETIQVHKTIRAYRCKRKRKAQVVWISLCSTAGLAHLLIFCGCIWTQNREKRRANERERAARQQDKELEATGISRVDGTNDIRLTKPVRRVPVLPTSRSRAHSAGSNVELRTSRVQKGPGGSSGTRTTEVGSSSIPRPN
jgi:hypothetical protein